jgi:TonB family protein
MFPNLTSAHFFGASIALHATLLLMAYSLEPRRLSAPANIPVSIFERVEKAPEAIPPPPPAALRERTATAPAKVAKNDISRARNKLPVKPHPLPPQSEVSERAEGAANPPASAPPPAREVVPEQTIIAERPLPSVRELLPPANWSSRSTSSGPVSLGTSDPLYVSYFTKVKQLIEAQWEYPELALRYGLQGKLALEFTIGSYGQLERARIVRSSGSQLLDDEALRAIKAAAPFPPIPSWIKPNPLSIVAAMEYHDNRVNYQFVR